MYGECAIDAALVKVGLGLQITVIQVTIPFDVGYNLHTKKTCIGAVMILSGLAGEMYAVVELRPLPSFDFVFFSWEGLEPATVDIYKSSCCHSNCRPSCVGGICDRTTGKDCLC